MQPEKYTFASWFPDKEEDELDIMIDKVLKSCQHTYMLVQELDNVLKAKNII